MKKQRNYDKKVKLTRILLGDYLALKQISLAAGVSMAEALHRLIEHQAQLPLMDRLVKPMPAIATQPMPAYSVGIHRPMSVTKAKTAIATNGSKAAAFRIKPKGVRYD
ncbi:hypothetical protein ES703_125626 [subsurface metagenome]